MLQRVWGWRCGLLQVLVVLSSAVAADSLYRLVTADVYVVFGGDLQVMFHMPGNVSLPNAFVKLQGRRPVDETWLEITTMGLPLGRKTGSLSAACGVVEFAGRYSLTMFMQVDGPVLTEVIFHAVWPSVVLRLPKTNYALTSSVSLEIDSNAVCVSRLHREFLTLELYFQRIVEDSNSEYARLSKSVKIADANLTALNKEQQKWEYSCRVFDLDGAYQALLRSSTGTTLSVSNVMDVTFSASYHLSSRRVSVFPCAKDTAMSVLYTHPPCSGVDKFRVYKLMKRTPGSVASPLEREYVGEFDTDPDQSTFEFNCSLFGKEAMGYCFVYVTVSRSGAVTEQNQFCLPAQPNAVIPQDGAWSTWTSWTSCSVTCGTGKRNRFRMCNSPSPEHGGQYCPGRAVQWTHCQVPCPDTLPRTPLRSPTFDPVCFCGCKRTADQSGEIVASGRCAGLATWIIKTGAGQQVTLTFRYYDVSYERQWVKVRDGESEDDDLLFFSRAQAEPSDITSSSNVMRVELMTEYVVTSPAAVSVFPKNATLPIHVRGFIASYESTTPTDAAELPPPLYRHVETTVMESDVTIVGIVVCAVVVVALVVFAVVQRKYWGRMPKYSAANEESPTHMVHSSSAQSSQPSSPGPHVQVDMDIPLTGGSSARRKSSAGQRAASRASSISSTCSAGLKKIRSRTEMVGGGDGGGGAGGVVSNGSPKPSTRDYSNLDSPYSNNASPEDSVHDANFFRASPIMRQVAPRSPKVHPHRLKASPGTPASPSSSPSITKHELLTRKRQERKGPSTPAGEAEAEREVTGSSGSSSAAKPSATNATITRAEINLVKPPDTRVLNGPQKAKSPLEPKVWSYTPKLRLPPSSEVKKLDAKLRPPPPDYYSVKNSLSASKRHSQGDKSPRQEEIPLMDSSAEDLQPHLQADPRKTPACEETSFIFSKTMARRPTSLTNSYTESIEGKCSKSRTPKSPPSTGGKSSAMEERQTLLPKPDGQSPKSSREETVGAEKEDRNSKESSSSPSKSSPGGKSIKTLSPSRSIATPELEYDDFIMDDPLSYFEYEDLSRLNWTGTEKLGRTKYGKDK